MQTVLKNIFFKQNARVTLQKSDSFIEGYFSNLLRCKKKASSNHDGRAEVTPSTATTSRTQQEAHYLCLLALCDV